MSKMFIGSHVSIRDGYAGAAKTALSIGANAFQYFPKNPRSLLVKTFDVNDAQACAQFCISHDMITIAHTTYPTNLAVESEQQREATIRSLRNDLTIAEACGSLGVVVHFGKYKGKDPLQGYKNILQCLNEALSDHHGNTLLLIENQAGEGGVMGTTFEEHVQIRSLSQYPDKIGFCLDTCHAFACGLWNGEQWPELAAEGQRIGYFKHLKAVHLNDSLYPSGSRRDRHANIGKGYIGESAFSELLGSEVMQGVPMILETPQSPVFTHQQEIRYVQSLIERR